MNLENANETDIREEVAAPLLTALGYERGTLNDILRERSLRYERTFLGRKKDNDPPLRGRADYILNVTGAARWAFEIKAPDQELTIDAIEQAITYARHPEVSATYAALTNGRQFLLFFATQRSDDLPIVNLNIQSVNQLADELSGILSPAAIRRDCSPPVVDLARPLAKGLRSSVNLAGGVLTYEFFEWESSVPLGPQGEAIQKALDRLVGNRENITEGRIYRDEFSRIIAQIQWAVGREEIFQFMQEKGFVDLDYVSLSSDISTDHNNPTIFDVFGNIELNQGEQIFDTLSWTTQTLGLNADMTLRGQGSGHIEGYNFIGNFQIEYGFSFPDVPGLQVNIYGGGAFSIILDHR
ncbi:hypothetical protein UF64_17180 [Thalassospira sp. HJ]|uniref:type I restriction enzyme HsdR N-terminal domain-containing protein n=1 Tax=Thalassospira sp. HJ TaxID=1616823 RepID=UPI0005CF1FD7|nr:type I restriction enzyme HsdR N-terminal domain-containing protein [Thalassospira sp. HJ]KJE34139.1 hypothetical protein UF64_17180 [Thalassospira sp. HJ]